MSQTTKSPQPEGKQQICAILLAAGRSRRMGAFKPLLPFGNLTVIESCVDYLKRGGIERIIVVVGHRKKEVQQALQHREVFFALNDDPSSPMAVSIARGVERVPPTADAILIALGDQPAIPAAAVAAVITQWRKGSKIIKPEFAGRGGHPVLIDLIYRSELLNLPSEDGLKSFFSSHFRDVFRLPIDSGLIARDIDTWDDYLALHQDCFGFAPQLEPDQRPNEKGPAVI
jgi:molybdenum cofactor cytidylyltransferase